MNVAEVTVADVDRLYARLSKDAEVAGYHLNPDVHFTKELIGSLIVNDNRYGYKACPCRLSSGNELDDIDIICPCDYRDPDLNEYGACYCALYVSEAVLKGEKQVGSIPERRPSPANRKRTVVESASSALEISETVWRCRVCGYLCAREQPPDECPICKAKKERFEVFLKATT